MKVLYLAPPRKSAERLTAFTFVDEEIVALARSGVDVYVLTYPVVAGQSGVSYPNVHLRILPPGKSLREYFRTLVFLWKARRLVPPGIWLHPGLLYHMARIERFAADVVRADDIDVIHSNFGWPDGFGGALARFTSGRPLVATMRGMDVLVDRDLSYGLRMDRLYDLALRVPLRHADRTTHVSDFIRHRAIELGARKSAAVTVKKGVDCEYFKDNPKCHDGRARLTILTVAGLIRRKGVDDIIKALGKLVESHDFEFVVAGNGPERDTLEALAETLRLQSRTRFMGYVGRDQIQRLFAAADIFVLGSIWEGSGNVLLEALASGCPVVCTDSGGPPEYVMDGVTGYVVPVRSPAAMADKIRTLLDDANLRAEFGRQAREQASERFRYARMIDDIVTVYRSVSVRQPTNTTGTDAAVSVPGVDSKVG